MMKTIGIVGAIALVMLLAVPAVMAQNTETMTANGAIAPSYTFSLSGGPSFDFGTFAVGNNEKDAVGTLTVTSAWQTWSVAAATTDASGKMMSGTTPLGSELQEYNYLAATPAWQNANEFSFTGPSTGTTSMTLSYLQPVSASDAVGTYQTTITYTITAT